MLDAATEAKGLLTLAGEMTKVDAPLAKVTAAELCFRAAGLLIFAKLQAVREEFPATMQALMVEPDPQINPAQDAMVDAADFLVGRDFLDLLSAVALPCIAPHLHRGWQDRTRSCQQARRVTEQVTGFLVMEEERRPLLEAWGICSRVFRAPPPVDLSSVGVAAVVRPAASLVARLASDDDALRALAEELTR